MKQRQNGGHSNNKLNPKEKNATMIRGIVQKDQI